MPYFKDKTYNVHYLDDAAFVHLLPEGCVEITDEEAAAIQNKPPSQAEIVAEYELALDSHLDAVARQNRYDNRITFSLRAGYAGPYQAEGIAFAQWMDECYVLSNQIKNSVIAGECGTPSVSEFLASMPEFALP